MFLERRINTVDIDAAAHRTTGRSYGILPTRVVRDLLLSALLKFIPETDIRRLDSGQPIATQES